MKGVATLAFLSFTVVGSSAGLTQALDVDWKFYGGAFGDSLCFYDANGVVRGPEDHRRVWIKCLPQKDVDAIDIKKDFAGKILENASQKIIKGYVPPIVAMGDIDFDQMPAVVGYEETANIGHIQPQASIFYELSCAERMLRELSISIQTKGQGGSRDKPGDWKYVPPEGNAARLLKILCPVR